MKYSHWSTACLVTLLCTALPLSGQGNETSAAVKHRNQCRLAAQVVRTGHPQPHRSGAIEYVAHCENEGPVVLAEQWQTLGGGGQDLEDLVFSSKRVRDNRLYQALSRTAADRSRPAAVRAGAMLVLVKYVDPASAIGFSDLVPPDSIVHIPRVGGSTTANNQVIGAVPVPGPVGAAVLALLESIGSARSEEPREVWYAAAVLARRVRSDIELGRAH